MIEALAALVVLIVAIVAGLAIVGKDDEFWGDDDNHD